MDISHIQNSFESRINISLHKDSPNFHVEPKIGVFDGTQSQFGEIINDNLAKLNPINQINSEKIESKMLGSD